MTQNPATKPLAAVPGYSRLFRRGATYYFRVGVPIEIRGAVGKREILKSLRTSNFHEAKRLVAFESADADALFAKERRQLKRVSNPEKLSSLSEADMLQLAREWFVAMEAQTEGWWAQEGRFLNSAQIDEMLTTLDEDERALNGGSGIFDADDGSIFLNDFLSDRGLECAKDSPQYRTLCERFREARLENLHRTRDRIQRSQLIEREPKFRGLFAHTILPKVEKPQANVTLGELLEHFLNFTKANRSETTLTSYQTPARVIREVLGEDTPLNAITRADVERLCEVLRKLPQNAQQRYPGLTAQKSIEAATKEGDTRRLGPKSLENYFINILAVFNYAVAEKFMTENPANYRSFREAFRTKETRRKALFTTEELKKLLSAPLYTGCKNDAAGFAQKGPHVLRRGRFWVPLIALFQGARCNEACQLYTEDVRTDGDIPYFAIRKGIDAVASTEKRLKNPASERNVPIHPTLIKMGFLEFVARRREDRNSTRLFPDLPLGNTGRYSNPFSKWFSGFLTATLGYKPKATFHSFRHHFRDALRAAEVGDENVEALGGWAGEGKQQREYGAGPKLRMLLRDLEKVAYPGLDLSHLFER